MRANHLVALVALVIFVSDDTITFGTNENQVLVAARYVLYAMVLIALMCVRVADDAARPSTRYWLVAGALVLAFAGTMIVNGDFRNGFFLQALIVVLAILLARHIPLSVFLAQYSSMLYWLSWISLAVFFLAVVARPVIDLAPVTTNYGGVEFSNLLVCAVFRDSGVVRNTSIFREPGVFALYLVVAIVIELFFREKPHPARCAVFVVTLVTTASTAGIAIFGLVAVGYMMRARSAKGLTLVAASLSLVMIGVFLFPALVDQVFSKFSEDSEEFASTVARLSSISVPFMIFADSPLFGVGLTQFVDQYLVFSEDLFGFPISPEGSSTNTLVNSFAIYGLLWGALMVTGVYKFAALVSRSSYGISALLFFAFVMVLSSQELRFSLLFNTLIMYGLCTRRNPLIRAIK